MKNFKHGSTVYVQKFLFEFAGFGGQNSAKHSTH